MLRLRATIACSLALASVACSAIVEPDSSRLAPRTDASVTEIDSGSPAPVEDAGASVGTDASSPGIDASRECTSVVPRCDGDVLIVCESGREQRTDCPNEQAFCASGGCRAWVCEPGARRCSADRRGVEVCDPRGASRNVEPCATRCEESTGACADEPTACEGLPVLALGRAERFSLCDENDDDSNEGGGGCSSDVRADAGDRTFALTIATRGEYTIDLRDVDFTADIDTVVYLRRACDDVSSEVACDDDVRCEESDVPFTCTDGVQVRQSRLEVDLEPGTYYVVADAIVYDSFECGTVELRASAARP